MTTIYTLLGIIICQSGFIAWQMRNQIDLHDKLNRKKIKRELKAAIKSEDYETAAKLRDRL